MNHYSASQHKSGGRLTGSLTFFKGVALGFLCGVLSTVITPKIYEKFSQSQGQTVISVAVHEPEAAPSFDFYNLLEQAEVVVAAKPSPSPNSVVPKAQTKALAQPASGPHYVLQIASFRDKADADALRAKLILNGIEAIVEQVTLADGQIWHRVKSQPYSNVVLAENVQQLLKKQSIDSILLKRYA